jgi:hypothetical protein
MDMSSMLDNSIDERSATTHSFRFGSGEVLALDEDQINRSPYLTALVSSADWFVEARDDQGHLKLDPNIQSKYLSFVLGASSSDSLYHLLFHLPVDYDVITMIAHLDFLGHINQGNPTLDEVDDTFFCTLVYDISTRTYSQRIRLYNFRNMAVRFTIALAKEEYDFADDQVMDRIYWYVMFILCAQSMFDIRLRRHAYHVAEQCFRLFKPSMLEPLEKLCIRTEDEVNQPPLATNDTDAYDDEQSVRVMERLIYSHTSASSRPLNYLFAESIWFEYSQLFESVVTLHDEHLACKKLSVEERFVEPLVATVSQMVYERLQRTIARRTTKKFLLSISAVGGANIDSGLTRLTTAFVSRASVVVRVTSTGEETIKRQLLPDLFESELVQGEIGNLISAAVPMLIRKLERRHLLVKEFRRGGLSHYIIFGEASDVEHMKSNPLRYERLLEKLHQRTFLVEDLYKRVLERLYGAAVKQITSWASDRYIVQYPSKSLSKASKRDLSVSSGTPQYQKNHKGNPLPKNQLKHSKR